MPILAGVAGNALASLSSIDYWISVLNSDVAASSRTGFKTSKITFGGGATRNDKPYANGALGIQYAEQALSVGSTNIDFSQGQVVASTEFTHNAINGSGNAFYVLVDNIQKLATTDGNDGQATAGARYYLSRDGEFHRDKDGYLVNANGLYVLGMRNTQATANVTANTSAGFVERAIRITTTDPTPELTMSKIVDSHNLNAQAGAGVADVNSGNYTYAHAFVNDLQALKYSKYGSTILEAQNNVLAAGNNFTNAGAVNNPTAAAFATTNGVFFHRASQPAAAEPNSNGIRVNGGSLEASNVQLPSTLVELSLAQKIYSALTKVIQVDQQKLDGVLNLIR